MTRYTIAFKRGTNGAAELTKAFTNVQPRLVESFAEAADRNLKPSDAVLHIPEIQTAYMWLSDEQGDLLAGNAAIQSVYPTRRVGSGGHRLTAIEIDQLDERLKLNVKDDANQPIPWNITQVKADQAWKKATGKGVRVGVLDNGINRNHPDLIVAGGKSFVPNIDDWDDDDGHGTHCAGIIAARKNAVGIVGVAPECDLYALKVMTHGGGDTDWIVEGMLRASKKSFSVVSMSFWDESGAATPDEPYWEDIQRAAEVLFQRGCLVVGISGNSGDKTNHWTTNPGRCPGVMAIGAVDHLNGWWDHSSYGPDTLPGNQTVEVVAPGVAVRSTFLNDKYAVYAGTSMACPHVAGCAALIKQQNPGTTPDEIRTLLATSADDLGPAGRDEKFGAGQLDCEKALGI